MDNQHKTTVRALVLPILKPADGGNWKQLRADLNDSFGLCRKAANLIVSAIYVSDMQAWAMCEPGEFPKAGWPNTYKIATRACPELPTKVASSVDQWVKLRYKGKNSQGHRVRIACMNGWQAVPNFTRVPIPLPTQGGYELTTNGADLVLNMPLLRRPREGKDGKPSKIGILVRHRVLLKTLDQNGRPRMQAQTLRLAIESGWKLGEARVFERGKNVMVAIACHVPVQADPDASGTMTVRFAEESLLEAYPPKSDRAWVLHADQLRQLLAAERRAQARLRDDYKFEPRREKRGAREVMRRRASRARLRVDALLHDLSRQVVGRAERARAQTIEIDDSCRDYLPEGGPYAELIGRIEQKAAQCGMIVKQLQPAK